MSDYQTVQVKPVHQVLALIWIFLMIAQLTWMCRNPTANSMTCYTRLPHVLAFDKLVEYQVVETHVSIGND